MFNKCLIHLFNCTCLNVMCVYSIIYINLSKKIFDHFICFWKWFLSLFVFMFSAYFVFHCLYMFCFEKQVSKFLATHFGYLRELWASCEFWLLVLVTSKLRVQAASSHKTVLRLTRDSPVANTQNQLFKEFFHGKLVLNLSHPL